MRLNVIHLYINDQREMFDELRIEGTRLLFSFYPFLLLVIRKSVSVILLCSLKIDDLKQMISYMYRRSSLLRAWIRLWASLGLMISGFYTIPVRGWSNYSLGRELRAPIVFNHESYVDPLVRGNLLLTNTPTFFFLVSVKNYRFFATLYSVRDFKLKCTMFDVAKSCSGIGSSFCSIGNCKIRNS